jgi:hypothetical protein
MGSKVIMKCELEEWKRQHVDVYTMYKINIFLFLIYERKCPLRL